MADPDKPIYHTLSVPDEAIANGGTEILRAGLVDDELYVTARHAFSDPAQWGEVLADITRRLGLLYSLETDLTEAEAIAEIEEAYATQMGARAVEDEPPRPKVREQRAAIMQRKSPRITKPATIRTKR